MGEGDLACIRGAIIIALLLLTPSSVAGEAMEPSRAGALQVDGWAEGTSWGLGIVVPEGAPLAGGGAVDYATTTNITALVRIPEIATTNGTTYAILSLMTKDGSVLQVAAGLSPGNGTWSTSAFFVSNIKGNPQVYHWILNSSAPRVKPGGTVSISIFRTLQGEWTYSIVDLDSGSAVSGPFGVSLGASLADVDQELVTLESYSTDPSTFQEMGRMVLSALVIDGQKATGDWYAYGDWNPAHDLPFVVGGATPPSFVGITLYSNGTAHWYFRGVPNVDVTISPGVVVFILGAGFGAISTAVALKLVRLRGGKNGGAKPEPE